MWAGISAMEGFPFLCQLPEEGHRAMANLGCTAVWSVPFLSLQVSCPQTNITTRLITLLTPMPWPSGGNTHALVKALGQFSSLLPSCLAGVGDSKSPTCCTPLLSLHTSVWAGLLGLYLQSVEGGRCSPGSSPDPSGICIRQRHFTSFSFHLPALCGMFRQLASWKYM